MRSRWSSLFGCLCASLVITTRSPAQFDFVRGDADGNGSGELTDAIFVLGFLFLGKPLDLPCMDAADADDNGQLGIGDPIYVLNYQFLGGSPPAAPFPSCGRDPSDDALSCETYDLCAPSGPPSPPSIDPPLSPTRSREIEISGRAGPSLVVRLTNGQAVYTTASDASGVFRRDLDLYPNYVNRIYAEAIDPDGRSSAPVLVSVIEDETPPALHVDEPVDGSRTTSESLVVAGRVSDMLSGFLGLTVTVAGEPAQVVAGIGTNGTFERSGVPLEPGANSIELVAVDAAGNTARRTISVERVVVPEGTARLNKISGDGQQGRIHETLPLPVVVRAIRGDGSPWPRKLITFEVTRSDGRLLPGAAPAPAIPPAKLQVRTDDQGFASVSWTLGGDAGCGNNRLAAKGDGLIDVLRFCASAAPGPAAQINVGTGDMLRAEAGGPAPEPLRAWVSDGCNGIGGIAVTFRVTKGGGRVNGESEATVTTAPTGHATVDFVLGSAPGNNAVEATFEENLFAPAVFTLYGVERKAGQPTSFIGIVEDNSNQPVGGAICELFVPGEEPIQTVTSVDGRFRFADVRGSGVSLLRIEGSPATRLGGESGKDIPPGSFPFLVFMCTVVPSAENSLPGPLLLPQLDPANRRLYDGTGDVVLEMAGVEGIRMKVKAGSMRLPNGSIPSPANPAYLSLNQVHHDDVPMPMPDGAAPQLAWTLQPGGSTFDPPVEVTYPNLSGLPAGTVANFLSFNHDTHHFEIVSSGHVTPDGASIVSDPGSGLSLAGWGCNCPPYSVRGRARCCRVTGITASPTHAVSPWELVTISAVTDPAGKEVSFQGDLQGATVVQAAGGSELGVVFNSPGKKVVSARCGTQSRGPSVTVQVVTIASIAKSPNANRTTYCKGEEVEHVITLASPATGVPIEVELVDRAGVVAETKHVATDGSGKASVKFVPTSHGLHYARARLKAQPVAQWDTAEAFIVIDFDKGKAELKADGEDDKVFSADPQGFCELMKINGRYKPPAGEDLAGASIVWEIAEVGGTGTSISLRGSEFKAQGPFNPGRWKAKFFCDANKNQQLDGGEPSVSTEFEVREMRTFPISVARHTSVPFTIVDAASQLARASQVFQRKDRAGDERCCIDLQLSGTVTTFSSAPADIVTPADWMAVSLVPAYVKIVGTVPYCLPPHGAFGCAELNSRNIVISQAAAMVFTTWAHEWGHTRGLDHPPDPELDEIMNGDVLTLEQKLARNVVSDLECTILELP